MCDRHAVVCLTLIIRVTGMEIGKWERVSKWERVPGWMKQIIQISSNTLFVSNSHFRFSYPAKGVVDDIVTAIINSLATLSGTSRCPAFGSIFLLKSIRHEVRSSNRYRVRQAECANCYC